MNYDIHTYDELWYFIVIIVSALSCIDPFLSLQFIGHKYTTKRKKFFIFKIILSAIIALLSLILPMQSRKGDLNLEQSNDILFITFSLFCFLKITTLLDEIIMKNKIIYNLINLSRQLAPFFLKIFTIYFLCILMYSFVGSILYGGRLNQSTIETYEFMTKKSIRKKYEYFHFNDIFSSILTLFVLVMQNNWIYVTELFYQVRVSHFTTTLFIVSFNLLVSFTTTALVLGLISKLIITFFDKDFEDIQEKLGKKAYSELASETQESEQEYDDYD